MLEISTHALAFFLGMAVGIGLVMFLLGEEK